MTPTEPTTQAIAPAHKIRRLYLKGASIEVPHMDRLPPAPVQPAVSIDVQTGVHEGWPGTLECILRVTAHARIGETVAFLIEITEAGVFELPLTSTEDELRDFASMTAPAILFPLARRDIAAMATAAGFQPVVPDHVDFEAIASRVARRQGVLLTPAPVSLRKGMVAVPLNAVTRAREDIEGPETQPGGPDTEPGEDDTQPAFVDTQPVPPLPVREPERRRTRGAWIAAAGVVAAMGAGAWWWSQREPTRPAEVQVTAPVAQPAASVPVAPASVSQPAPAASAPPLVEPPPATNKALEESRERLAALPPGWRSIEIGQMDADADLRALESLPLQAPLYVVRLPEGQLQVLYGAYPSQEAAAAALEETRGWKAQGLRGEPRIVVPGRAS